MNGPAYCAILPWPQKEITLTELVKAERRLGSVSRMTHDGSHRQSWCAAAEPLPLSTFLECNSCSHSSILMGSFANPKDVAFGVAVSCCHVVMPSASFDEQFEVPSCQGRPCQQHSSCRVVMLRR